MPSPNQLILGTWQFETIDEQTAAALVAQAHDTGIRTFDTAAVYACGNAERILGKHLHTSDTIITKTTAVRKGIPSIATAYPKQYIEESVAGSVERLGRMPDVMLMHNWDEAWEADPDTPATIDKFRTICTQQGIPLIGISLPNGYSGSLEAHANILDAVDCLEAPYNQDSPSLSAQRLSTLSSTMPVLVRSIFRHGRDTEKITSRLQEAVAISGLVVVGATKPEQIQQWSTVL